MKRSTSTNFEKQGSSVVEPQRMDRRNKFLHTLSNSLQNWGEDAMIDFCELHPWKWWLLTTEKPSFSHTCNHTHSSICPAILHISKILMKMFGLQPSKRSLCKESTSHHPCLSKWNKKHPTLRHRIASIFSDENWSVSPFEERIQIRSHWFSLQKIV